ncbi:SAM-dependent methyltransferase [Muribaculaceae bacterium Isolate-002 (NCI)]|nr:SAM-dependent methyltransferase [Muribaculaceae bacterium Isolate-002 (NCI)]
MISTTDSGRELTVERTDDGSATLYISALDEHYHSTKGALAESLHVYIDTCWRQAARRGEDVRVFEVGFGTGLNAALTAEAALREKVPTVYISVELHPLDVTTVDMLGYDKLTPYYAAVNRAEWGREVVINPYFSLIKIAGNFLEMELPANIDAVYYDAFAPEKQPEMWSEEIIYKLYSSMAPGGMLTTYCAKGVIRRRLQSAGFTVERLPGPANGKREILRATREV